MRRYLVASVAALLVVGTVAGSPPAAADAPDWPLECLYELPDGPGFGSVYFDANGRLIVNPEAAPDDAGNWASHAPGVALSLASCLTRPVPTAPVTCVYQKLLEIVGSLDPVNLNLRYVYPNPQGPGTAVDYPLLISDATYLLGCRP